jgi:hypothetical protein
MDPFEGLPPEMRAAIAAIPPEISARSEAGAFFDALFEGDYAKAARAQERIQQFGYYVGRAPEKKAPRKPRTPRKGAP